MLQNLIEPRDYETYLQLFKHMSHFMCRPNVIIYLDLTPESSLERIKQRGRSVESKVPLEYLQILHQGYEEFIADISRSIPVIRVGWEEFRNAEDVVEMIKESYFNENFSRDAKWRPTQG